MKSSSRLLWWREPAVRADLEHALARLNKLHLHPPEGSTAYFCDLCEALIGLLETAQRCATVPEERAVIAKLRTRLDHQLEATVFVNTAALSMIEDEALDIFSDVLDGPNCKLAIYGTLAPGEINYEQVAEIEGEWIDGFVRGDLHHTGWGADYGFPALIWRPDGPRVPVKVLCSPDLPRHWQRLDAFEGDEYRRIHIPVELDEQVIAIASLYADRQAMVEAT